MRTYTAEQLRARARGLRQLAAKLGGVGALTLRQRAGEDAWIGPVADRCRDDLCAVRREVQCARDDLIQAARTLEHQAADLERAVLAPGGVA